jgi:hypothetical protein
VYNITRQLSGWKILTQPVKDKNGKNISQLEKQLRVDHWKEYF